MKNIQVMRKSRSHWKHVVLEAKEYTPTARLVPAKLCSTQPSPLKHLQQRSYIHDIRSSKKEYTQEFVSSFK
jgi:hypothetical protein